ncbi:MAG TPA: phospho-sugar mutase [Dermatophilaceae bacterium]|nr:phospho-sugar mutase [Dermatophilaceae bacterium]
MGSTAVHGGPLGSPASGEPLHPGVLEAARAWADDDPDPQTREELTALAAVADGGDVAAAAELTDRMSGLLTFGTAGLRGALAGGPNRMNRAVVIRAAAGLTAYLQDDLGTREPFVVVGFDARRNSDVFARDTAAVVTGLGGRAAVLPHPLPTPVLAYAVRLLGADAGVMVTASHNPPQDNGYKVYLGDGRQIVPPADAGVAAHIAAVRSVALVPRPDDGWETLPDDVHESYLDAVAGVLDPASPREVHVVHTALHGVGTGTVRAAFARAGFPEPLVVPSQAEPDPAFPTVGFPNPEEPGAMDAALELAEQTGPDLVVANDPDADRCAVAVPGRGGWRMLTGDELGVLLGVHLLRRGRIGPGRCFASSVVSSRLLAAVCAAAGVRHEETLTGFKWIARAEGLRYGYEEALGYCAAPDVVLDKDGVSAALLVAECVAGLRADGRGVEDLLDEVAAAHGVHLTGAHNVRVSDLSLTSSVMARLRAGGPAGVAAACGSDVAEWDDLARGYHGLPPTEGLRWVLADGSRVVVRPSGTEPKLKAYLEVVEPVPGGDVAQVRPARDRASLRLGVLQEAVASLTAPV